VEDRGATRRKASTRAFVGPLLMLLGGALAGALLLRNLLLEPPPSVVGHTGATEQLSHDDRVALERLMRGNAAH
jgi:hypothetical protein